MSDSVQADHAGHPTASNHTRGEDAGPGQTEAVTQLCTELWEEPLFHLSLNSKELFHSNLLAWFIETYPQEASAALSPWTKPSEEISRALVLREQSHLDLAIALPGLHPLVIENKVFSPPDDDQLDRYAAGSLAGFEDPSLLLLSLMEPSWSTDTHESPNGKTWRFVSYRDLADRLEVGQRLLERRDSESDRFAADVIAHYQRLISALHDLVQVTGSMGPTDPVDIPEPFVEPLSRVRLQGAVGKLRARQALRALRSALPAEVEQKVRWESSFTNGTPLISAYYLLPDGDHIGWQYQQGQWRLMAVTRDHKGKTAKAQRHKYVAERYIDWFDFEPFTTISGRPLAVATRTELAGGFNDYNPDFVYRYRKAPGLTVDELTALSTQYLTRAHRWVGTGGRRGGVGRAVGSGL